jgi:dGTPase
LAQEIDQLYPGLERARLVHELGRRLVTRFIEDAIVESRRRIAEAGVGSMEDVRAAGRALVGFSPGFANAQADIKSFLSTRMYRHPDVMRVREKADEIVRRLFDAFLADPSGMPTEWALAATRAETAGGEASRARVVADYIAGMTDRYALSEHRRIFDDAPDLR